MASGLGTRKSAVDSRSFEKHETIPTVTVEHGSSVLPPSSPIFLYRVSTYSSVSHLLGSSTNSSTYLDTMLIGGRVVPPKETWRPVLDSSLVTTSARVPSRTNADGRFLVLLVPIASLQID